MRSHSGVRLPRTAEGLLRAPCLLLSLLLILPFVSGCRSDSTPATTAPATAARTSSPRHRPALSELQRSPAYQAARHCFQQKDYAGALARLNTLLSDPRRSAEQRRFLQHQITLCQTGREAGHPGKQPVPSPVPPPRASSPNASDCGPRALLFICQEMQIPARLTDLSHAAGTTEKGTTLAGLQRAAKQVGLKAEGVQMDRKALARLSSPALAWVDGNHFLAVFAVHGDTALVHDPNQQREEEIPVAELLRRSGGIFLVLARPTGIVSWKKPPPTPSSLAG